MVATTRPETMLGDTAVAVHPEDETVPPPHRQDAQAPHRGPQDPDRGRRHPGRSGVWNRGGQGHARPRLQRLRGGAPPRPTDDQHPAEGWHASTGKAGPFQGLTVQEARRAVKEKIEEVGLFRGTKDHTMNLGRSQRSGAVVEPMLSTQWFVRMKPLAGPALAAVEHGFTRFVPKQWENTYFAWLRDIKRLVHQPSAVVGAPDPCLVLPGAVVRSRWPATVPRPSAGRAAAKTAPAGPRRAGHLVLVSVVAVLGVRLATEAPPIWSATTPPPC